MKKVRWLGTAREDLISFPKPIRADLGYAIDRLQHGLSPLDSKFLLPGGVFELRTRDASGAYRVAYCLKLDDNVVIIHCFKKKTQKTSKKDLEIIRKRMKEFQSE